MKDEIIRRHQEEFNYSKVLNKIIKQETNLSFDDDELAYITLHFVVANNKMNKLYKTKPVFRSFYIKYGEKNTGSQFVTQYFLILFFA